MPLKLTDADEFRRITQLALKATQADDLVLALRDSDSAATRIANNQIVQNTHARRRTMRVTAAFGQQHGSASTTDFGDESVRAAVARAEGVARVAPLDPEYLRPLGPRPYPVLPTLRAETLAATPERLIADAATAIRLCQAEQLTAAGIVSAGTDAIGLAASSGLLAFEQRSAAEFSLTASGADSSGWVKNADRSIDALGVAARTRIAIDKARRSAQPRELPPGRYTVILEPAAVAGLFGALRGALSARAYHKRTSALAGRLGQTILDPAFTLSNRPEHPSLLGASFDDIGLPADHQVWIERGVLKRLDYDRFTASVHKAEPTFSLDAPYLEAAAPVGDSVEDLVRTTQRGILVTNFWYIRAVNATDLTMTGMTRDGTFLVEDGRILGGLVNFRWHDSPLRAFSAVDGATTPHDAITMESGKMMLPAIRVRDFNFSSVTKF